MGSHFSPIYTAEKSGPDHFFFFLTVYKGNNQVRFMVETCVKPS